MYDPADVPFEIYVHADTLRSQGGCMPRSENDRINIKKIDQPSTHLSLPKSTLRSNGGYIGSRNASSTIQTNDVPGPIYQLNDFSQSTPNGGRFNLSNTPSVLDQYINQRRSIPGPSKYRLPEHRIQSISIGQATRPIFRRVPWADEPGPALYNVSANIFNSYKGVKFGNVKNIEKKQQNVSSEPGPGHFKPNYEYFKRSNSAAKISDAILPSESDAIIKRGVPGPSRYTLSNDSTLSSRGVTKFSTNKIKSELEKIIMKSSNIPGPGHVHSKSLMNHGKRSSSVGKISTANPKSDLDWAVHHAKNLPAPGDYNINNVFSNNKTKGKFSTSVIPSFVEQAAQLSLNKPGPGEYRQQKEYTMLKCKSSAFVMKTKTERFPAKRIDPSIVDSSSWIKKKSVPSRPGDYEAPSFTMGARIYVEEKIDRSIHSPTKIKLPDSFGKQIRSDKPNSYTTKIGGKSRRSGAINSPVKKYNIGPAEYNVFESFLKIHNRKDWSGKNAVKAAKLKNARLNLAKWRAKNNF
jgi:hypothetical protein